MPYTRDYRLQTCATIADDTVSSHRSHGHVTRVQVYPVCNR